MASERQARAARRNVTRAQRAARRYELQDIPGRSKMGKSELIDAIRRGRG